MDRKEEYRGYKFWLVETTILRQQFWRIEYPNGHVTPPLPITSAAGAKSVIDNIIAVSGAQEHTS